MNEFITDVNGGFPLFLDDIRFLDSTFRNSLISLVRAITGGDGCVLSGINITPDEPSTDAITVSSGFIFSEGNIYYFPGQIIENYNPSTIYVFKISQTLGGTRILANSDVVDAYKIFTAYLEVASEVPNQNEVSLTNFSVSRLQNRYERAFAKNTGFNKNFATQTQTLAGAANVVMSPQNLQQHGAWLDNLVGLNDWDTTSIKYRKLSNGFVEIKGELFNYSPTSDVLFILPDGYIPTSFRIVSCFIESGLNDLASSIFINHVGQCHILKYNPSTLNIIQISAIFSID